jgi:hypothetical protein
MSTDGRKSGNAVCQHAVAVPASFNCEGDMDSTLYGNITYFIRQFKLNFSIFDKLTSLCGSRYIRRAGIQWAESEGISLHSR